MNHRYKMNLVEAMLNEGGHTFAKISEATGVGKGKISDMATAMGKHSPRKFMKPADHAEVIKLVRQGKTDHEIAKIIGVDGSSIFRFRVRQGLKSGRYWLRHNIREYRMKHPGTTQVRLAKVFECNRGTVMKALKESHL